MKSSILIVDNDQTIVDTVSAALSDENYSIFSTTDPLEGLKLFEKHAPICIILDLKMPKMSGIDFIEKIELNYNSKFSVIILTGHKTLESSKECYQKGVFEIVQKPMNIYDLMSIVRNAVMLQQRTKRISYQEHIGRLSRDRTDELIKKHNNLNDAREVIERAYKLKSELISDISHEVRNPLNVLMNFSSMLIEMYQQKDFDDFENILEAIHTSSNNLAMILDNIITLSEIEHGSVNEEIESFDLNKVMLSIVSLFEVKAADKFIDFSYSISKDLTENIVADKIKFKQIVMAMMGFGYSHTKQKGAINLNMDINRDRLELITTFTDISLGDDEINSLFKSNIDMSADDLKGYRGLGIGLPMSKKYAKLMKGDLLVKNATPKECSLSFTLPFVEAVDPTRKADWTDIQFKPGSKILLVEDQPINVMIIKKMLKKMGIEIDVAMNGKIAINKAKQVKPDLILMDIQMPVMDGLEATRIIRKTKGIADTPIIGVSAYSAKEKEMLNMEFTDFIVKPINKASFITVLSKYLERA